MSSQVKQIALTSTNALKQSMNPKALQIKHTTNFPISLITELRPSLKYKFTTTKTPTNWHLRQFETDTDRFYTTESALMIEAEDQSIIDEVSHMTRYIHHHSSRFNLSASRSISPVARPSVHIFRRPEYRTVLKDIASKYSCKIWCHDNTNSFGIFCEDNYDKLVCMNHIRNYIQSVSEQHMDYVQCNEVLKPYICSQHNKQFMDIVNHCNTNYKTSEYHIERRQCDRGYIWIWCTHNECRQYIKQQMEDDIAYHWRYKYINIPDNRLSILYGRPHNQNGPKRHNEFWKMFRFDEDSKCCYFWNKMNKKRKFYYKHVPNTNDRDHQMCIIININHYDNASDAQQALDDIKFKVNECLHDNVQSIELSKEHQSVLTSCFTKDIDYSIRWSGDAEHIYVKYDEDKPYLQFKSLLFDRLIPNTMIVRSFSSFAEIDVFQKLLRSKLELKLIHVFNDGKGNPSLVLYDDKIGDVLKLKRLVQNVVEQSAVIELSAKEWRYLNVNKAWNAKTMQNEFTKCCIALCSSTADKMLFYGSDYAKKQVVNAISSATSRCVSQP
eukprot:597871_1